MIMLGRNNSIRGWSLAILLIAGSFLSLFVSILSSTTAYAALSPEDQKKCYDGLNGKGVSFSKNQATYTVDGSNQSALVGQCVSSDNTQCTMTGKYMIPNGNGDYTANITCPASYATAAAAAGAGTTDGANKETETCNLTGIGWLVCPVSIFLSGLTEGVYSLVEKLLVFDIEGGFFDTNNPIYKIWNNIRNLANVAFIISLFVVIYSQATGMGISSYGIKKMLPRIFVSAILVNLSYYICVLGIDISNIIGAGLDGMIKSVLENGANTSPDTTQASGGATALGLTVLTTALLAGSVAAAGGMVAALSGLLVFLPVILLALLTALVVLLARQALIVILIVISALAFVARILPNTEKFYDTWQKAFVAMLIFYPLVALLFSGSEVAASVIRLTANSGTGTDNLIKVLSLGVQLFPLFGMPFLLKFSGGVLGRVAGMVNNPNKGPFDRMRKNMEGVRDSRRDLARSRAFERETPDYNQKKFGRARRFGRGFISPSVNAKTRAEKDYQKNLRKGIAEEAAQEYIAKTALNDNMKEGDKVTSGAKFATRMAGSDNPQYIAAVQASAQATADKLDKQSVANREVLYRAKIKPGDLATMKTEFQKASTLDGDGDATAIKALQNLMISNGSAGVDALRTSTETVMNNPATSLKIVEAMKKNIQENHGQTIKQKSADMLYWATDAAGKSFNDHSANPGSWSKLAIAELASQTSGSLKAADAVGAISPVRANEMLSDKRVVERLGEDQIAVLKQARERSTADHAQLLHNSQENYRIRQEEHAYRAAVAAGNVAPQPNYQYAAPPDNSSPAPTPSPSSPTIIIPPAYQNRRPQSPPTAHQTQRERGGNFGGFNGDMQIDHDNDNNNPPSP